MFSLLFLLFQTQSTVAHSDDTGLLLAALGFALASILVIMGIVLAALRPESAD
jgi:hypothetical protein